MRTALAWRLGVTRTSGVGVALLAVAALMAPPALADETLQATGSITYTWQGSPSLGCTAIGVCDVQGALIVEAQGPTDAQTAGHQTIITLDNSSATVRVVTGTGQSASECVDSPPNPGGASVFVRRSGGGLVGAIEPALSSGRCAGPLASDLSALTLPVRRSPGKHPSFDLRTSRSFSAGPFAGTMVSTVTMRPAASGAFSSSSSSLSGSFFPASPKRRVFVEHVKLRYRVTGLAEPLVVAFSGESDPFCAVLDSCGASGDVALSAPAFSGTLTLQGSRQVARLETGRQVIADIKRGRISVFGAVSSGLLTSETFVRGDGSRCQDSAANEGLLGVGGPARAGRTNAVLTVNGNGLDALRTHCPGPAFSDAFGSGGQAQLAQGPANFIRLLARRSTLTLGSPGGFSGLGYVGSRTGALGFSLSLEGIRASTNEETQ
jgi:hypothetical protein